jgi:hypothetical protein
LRPTWGNYPPVSPAGRSLPFETTLGRVGNAYRLPNVTCRRDYSYKVKSVAFEAGRQAMKRHSLSWLIMKRHAWCIHFSRFLKKINVPNARKDEKSISCGPLFNDID